jgi:hypothetical protein
MFEKESPRPLLILSWSPFYILVAAGFSLRKLTQPKGWGYY